MVDENVEKKMKAVIYPKYGAPELLSVQEVERPSPKDNEVLIKIHATTVNAADARMRRFDVPFPFSMGMRMMLGFSGPRSKMLGVEIAGEVVSKGKDVTQFKDGDQVFASTGMKMSGHSEFICLKEKSDMAIKPSNMTFEEAAAVPHCGLTALHFLRKGNVHKGQKVLIYGASGGIGTFAVQIAKEMGAEVTGVCSTKNIELVRSLGASHVIDYTKENLSSYEDTFDVIFDTVGKSDHSECVKALKKGGHYLGAVHMEIGRIAKGVWTSITTSKKFTGGVAGFSVEGLNHLKELIEAGKVRSVIDKTYSLDEMVEANRYVDTGHKSGHVAVTVA
jgi:NADPH:quinone reductase-like Zn-dependent oxidoreductase